MTSDIAVFHFTGATREWLREELDAHQVAFEEWFERFQWEARERWGLESMAYDHRDHIEIIGLRDPHPEYGDRADKDLRQEGVPDGWRRLKTEDGLRPVRKGGGEPAKAAREWVRRHQETSVKPAIGKIAELLEVNTRVIAGLRMASFGFADYDEDGMFLLWPARVLEEFESIERDDHRENALATVVPSVPHERVRQSTYQLARERAEERGGQTHG